jgi:hypothetical protein
MPRLSRWAALAAILLGAHAPQALTQEPILVGPPSMRKPVGLLLKRPVGAIKADAGGTITATLQVRNPSLDTLTVVSRVSPPADWVVILGESPFTLGPRASDTWMLSVRVPSRTAAGRYAIRLRAIDAWGHFLLADSILVEVRSHRAVKVALAERPTYGVSGTPYEGRFLVHNVGNVAATFSIRARSSVGTVQQPDTTLTLAANESRIMTVRVAAELPSAEAVDDVIVLRVADTSDSTVAATSSARITVVQRAGEDAGLHTVSSTLRVRAAEEVAGVSRYELVGGGALRDGGRERLDFVVRSKPAYGSPFGDREEYHAALEGAHFSLEGGDALYQASRLTSASQRGTGGRLTLGDSSLGIGYFAQRFRFQPDGGMEQGAFVHLGSNRIFASPHLGVSGVDRSDGPFAGRILAASGSVNPVGDMAVNLEYAASNGDAGRGVARSARVGAGTALHLDAGHLDADSSYAGPLRDSRYDYVSMTTAPLAGLQLRGSFTSSRTSARFLAIRSTYDLHTGVAELSYRGRFAVGYTSYARAISLLPGVEMQRGVTARAEQGFGPLRFWGSGESGQVTLVDSTTRAYGTFTGGVSVQAGGSSVSLFGESSRDALVLRGAERVAMVGVDAQLQLTRSTRFAVMGSSSRTQQPDVSYAYADARLMQLLPNGATITARVRIGGQDLHEALLGQRLAYLEYSTPLQLPIGPSREPGRVQGRVVDQQTGRGIGGALVRLGPQAAITDDDGRVSFAGLPAGSYRVALAQQMASGATVFNGNPNVRVDSGARRPATFNVAVEPAGRIAGSIRRLVVARTGIGSEPDSLADGGPVEGVTVLLIGARDTLYRTTDASGQYVFTDVPSGSWTVVVQGELSPQTQWEHERVTTELKAGAALVVDFRLVPRRRRVKIVGGDGFDESKQDRQDRQERQR